MTTFDADEMTNRYQILSLPVHWKLVLVWSLIGMVVILFGMVGTALQVVGIALQVVGLGFSDGRGQRLDWHGQLLTGMVE